MVAGDCNDVKILLHGCNGRVMWPESRSRTWVPLSGKRGGHAVSVKSRPRWKPAQQPFPESSRARCPISTPSAKSAGGLAWTRLHSWAFLPRQKVSNPPLWRVPISRPTEKLIPPRPKRWPMPSSAPRASWPIPREVSVERGFKSRCEQMARSIRVGLGLKPVDPLDPLVLAGYLGVQVWDVTALGLSEEDETQLVQVDRDAWSAVTVSAYGRDAIIMNPSHRGGRQSSDLMHELAHLLLRHEPSTVFLMEVSDLALRGYNPAAEDEANWLAAALLLPREALVRISSRRMAIETACSTYGVSERMLRFRMNVTGVASQFSRRHRPAQRQNTRG